MNDVHIHCFQDRVVRLREEYFPDENFRLLFQNAKSKIADAEGVHDYLIRSKTEEAVVLSFSWNNPEYLDEQLEYFIRIRDRFSKSVRFFANICFSSKDIEKEIRRVKESGFSGIGEIAFYDGNVRYDYIDEILFFAAKENLPVNIHLNDPVGHNYPGKYSTDFSKLSDVLLRNHESKVIFSHLGGGFLFYFLMPEVRSALPNVYFDISASPFLYSSEVFRTALLCAPGKILFGTDFPLIEKDRYLKVIQDECLNEITAATDSFFSLCC
ncbi:MAG: amidohydrolase family protein [Spirochaetes bacterium]|nr:amidohydrolase family protein [Spirochaetota bacterium]